MLEEQKVEKYFVHKSLISLKGRNNFLNFSKGANSTANSSMVMICKSNQFSFNRAGIITKKKLGISPLRNKVRRRIREALRFVFENKSILGYDFIIIVRQELLLMDYNSMKQELAKQIKHLTSK